MQLTYFRISDLRFRLLIRGTIRINRYKTYLELMLKQTTKRLLQKALKMIKVREKTLCFWVAWYREKRFGCGIVGMEGGWIDKAWDIVEELSWVELSWDDVRRGPGVAGPKRVRLGCEWDQSGKTCKMLNDCVGL